MNVSHLLPILILFIFFSFLQDADAQNCLHTRRFDLIFVVDTGGAILPVVFRKVQKFLSSLVHMMYVDPVKGIRVGLIQYSWPSRILLNLTTNYDKADVLDVIENRMNLKLKGKSNFPPLKRVEELLLTSLWRGPEIPTVVVFLINEVTQGLDGIVRGASGLGDQHRTNNIFIFSDASNDKKLQSMTQKEEVLQVDSYRELDNVKLDLISRICKAVTKRVTTHTREPPPPQKPVPTQRPPPSQEPVPTQQPASSPQPQGYPMLDGLVQESGLGHDPKASTLIDSMSSDSVLLFIVGGIALLIVVVAVSSVLFLSLKRKVSPTSCDQNQSANLFEASGSRSGMKSDDEERNTYDQKSLDSRSGRRRSENHEQSYGGILDKSGENIELEASTE